MLNLKNAFENIAAECGVKLSLMSAARLTTFKGGGSAYVFAPDSEGQFINTYVSLAGAGFKPFILGGGSNTVIADGEAATPIISTNGLDGVYMRDNCISAGCGASLRRVSAMLSDFGYSGFGFMNGVPATVGGALRMNASAFGRCIADMTDTVRIFLAENNIWKIKEISAKDISFGYRRGVKDIVLSADFKLIDDLNGENKRDFLGERIKKQPKKPSCGSVFKNGDIPSGKLIEECGLKGIKCGGAQISGVHANFIVNLGNATASDFLSLAELCENEVMQKFSIKLEREFELVI